jgi:hypothetical protein
MTTQHAIKGYPHSVTVSIGTLALCEIKSRYAHQMTRDEMQALSNWCDWQDESLWDDMELQEILNVYRVSAKYVTWQGWVEESPRAAKRAWNQAIYNNHNLMSE